MNVGRLISYLYRFFGILLDPFRQMLEYYFDQAATDSFHIISYSTFLSGPNIRRGMV